MTPEEEKKYFKSFAQLSSELSNGQILEFNEKGAWPDVLFRTSKNSIIAIELTELLSSTNINKIEVRKQQNLEDQLLNHTLTRLKKSKIPQKFFIDILVNHRNPLKNTKEVRKIGETIFDFLTVQMNNHVFGSYKKLDFENALLKKNKIDKISVYFSNNITTITANIGSSGVLMNSITNEEVSTIIYKKDQLIKPFAQVF
ncbi:MAG: hypothetical protein RIC06_23970 [Cyclobacteriaceae bacterium]